MGGRSLKRYIEVDVENQVSVGNGLYLEFKAVSKKTASVYLFRNGTYIRMVKLADGFGVKCFIVEAVRSGVHKTKLAAAFNMSRQTIDNYYDSVEKYGIASLLSNKLNDEKQIRKKVDKKNRIPANKSKALSEERKAKKEEYEYSQMKINFSFGEEGEAADIAKEDQPFNEIHNWKNTRYAGVFVYIMMLTSQWKWLKLIMGYSGKSFKIFMVFLLLAAKNLPSIEQLKNVHSREAGLVLGISRIPSIPYVWKWFYAVVKKGISVSLISDFFRYQTVAGIVSMWSWFIDGHLLPYSGKEKVHYSFNTQRRIPYPGQTNLVATDGSGKIVNFEIQEGHGDLKGHIIDLSKKKQSEFGEAPIMVFDREGYGADFFHNLLTNNCSFVCWEKNTDKKKLNQIEDSKFDIKFKFNGAEYEIFEGERKFTIEKSPGQKITFTLRKIYIWNKRTNKRVCGLGWTAPKKVSAQDCAQLILNRWGASENTFKHIAERHPYHYRPGFQVTKSEKQDIANPDLKQKENQIKKLNRELNKVNSDLLKTKAQINKDGTPRLNSKHENLKSKRQTILVRLETCQEEKKNLPKR
ncbi:MAG: hypothetical protein U9P79_09300, partial [Candidatus Cloacimonadota bacterium]|nr:hypothetical protein [Candidatus Cloacimonadota bacterium]